MIFTRSVLALAASAASVLLTGCENGMKDMYDQAKYKPLAASQLWPDGRASRPLEDGTIAHSGGALAGTSSGRRNAISPEAQRQPSYTRAEILRGQQRFTIFCEPCHGPAGDGDGYITRRGFPHPPTYHSDRLRQVPDDYIYHVITDGYGVMYPYEDRVRPEDRWAIVAYIRALQLSQHATLEDVPQGERSRLADAP